MPMTAADLKRVIRLLGPKGTAAGLRESDVTLDELRQIANKAGVSNSDTAERDELIDCVVRLDERPTLKPLDELMAMSFEELMAHFIATAVSNKTLLEIMAKLNYKVGAEDKKHLKRFAARQISETALFSKVAAHK